LGSKNHGVPALQDFPLFSIEISMNVNPGELKQQHGELSIHQRCFNGEVEAVQHFINDHHNKLSEKDEDGRSLLHWACSGSHVSIAKLLLDARIIRNIQDDSGMNELMVAASVGSLDICKMLIKEVKDCVNSQGRSSLFFCCSKGHFDILKLLVENGSDVNHQDKQGQVFFVLIDLFIPSVCQR
jgi:ankyrin repeat protein